MTDLTNADDLLIDLLPTSVYEHFISSTDHSASNILLNPIELNKSFLLAMLFVELKKLTILLISRRT